MMFNVPVRVAVTDGYCFLDGECHDCEGGKGDEYLLVIQIP